MDVRRYFPWPFIAVLVAVIPILLFVGIKLISSSGTAYRQAKFSHVIALIDTGQVRSARLIEDNHVIQITTSGPHPQHLEASWPRNRGPALARQLQKDYNSGKLPRGYTVAETGGPNSILGILLASLPYAVVILIILGVLVPILLAFRRRPRK
jgi:cell division protease FtsH